MILCKADITSKNNEKVARYLRNFELVEKKMVELEEKDKVRNFKPPVTGDEIIKLFNIPPGKIIGDIKEEIKEAILEGHIRNDRQEAYELLLKIAREKGLTIHELNT
jgi:tRNA nucleotidyltransferase/poly(A) polymerase